MVLCTRKTLVLLLIYACGTPGPAIRWLYETRVSLFHKCETLVLLFVPMCTPFAHEYETMLLTEPKRRYR